MNIRERQQQLEIQKRLDEDEIMDLGEITPQSTIPTARVP
eukprot:CAMPEP_0170480436 /NCGR_PEP_ID=MMETSP0208-20121228/1283_1 /TAXON_ID=197538 /ORGANISM="Strombidium inclinatum, Strain S3" /LENGTH=39 /DNA_ID= /DNA_START= /DNA_END= /DNA_ORIENTATION=